MDQVELAMLEGHLGAASLQLRVSLCHWQHPR
jgi:hypothetical protein